MLGVGPFTSNTWLTAHTLDRDEAEVPPASSPKQLDVAREELRGLFVLGLIAVIATVRSTVGTSYSISIGSTSLDIVPLLNFILVMWSIYAFLIVLGLSVSDACLSFARIFLILGLVVTMIISTLAAVLGYAPYSYYIAALALASVMLLMLPKYLLALPKKLRRANGTFKISLDFVAGMTLFTVFLLLFELALSNSPRVDYGQDATLVGLVSIVGIALARFWRFVSAHRGRLPQKRTRTRTKLA
jgi:uncharacterized membrane protein